VEQVRGHAAVTRTRANLLRKCLCWTGQALDLVWRGLAIPFRALFKRQDPILYPEERVPARFVGLVGGLTYTSFPDNLWNAIGNLSKENGVDVGGGIVLPAMLLEVVTQILAIDSAGGLSVDPTTVSEGAWGWQGQVAFYVGNRFMSSTGRSISGSIRRTASSCRARYRSRLCER